MTTRPSASSCLIVRTISDSPTSDFTVMRGGKARRPDQMLMDLFGSQSSKTTPAPAWANSVARITDAVDLPAPPLGEATVRTGISDYPIFSTTGYIE